MLRYSHHMLFEKLIKYTKHIDRMEVVVYIDSLQQMQF